MPNIEIKIPSVGESINEATIGRWNFKTGDWVEKDAVIFEIETEKATLEVNAPASGVLSIQKNQGEVVPIGSTVGTIETGAAKPANAPASPTKLPPPPPPAGGTRSMPPPPPPAKTSTPSAPTPTAVSSSGQSSGPGLATYASSTPVDMKGFGPAKRKAVREGKIAPPSSGGAFVDPLDTEGERKPMSTIRKKIAERLIHSQQSTATLTTFNEVDMSNILSIRSQLKEEFQKKHGVKLGFMSFFARAVAHALGEVPSVNAFIDGNDMIFHRHLHLGVAVSTDRGLVVPVVKYADQLSYADLEKNIAALAEKARTGKLGIEEMMGGTFTLTNGGVFGSLLSTPILNPPQSGILGMHKTENRPMAIEQGDGSFKVEVRPMMYVALSYDHRLIDGRDSVTFLVKAKEYLETVKAEEVIKGQ